MLLNLAAAVSISYSGGIYNLTNSYASYYVNQSGFQVTNVNNEFWSHNVVCIYMSVAGIAERCVDTLPWTWTNYSNGNMAQLNGTTSWLFAVGRNVTVKMQYYLDDVDTRIKMNLSITYLGSRTLAGDLIWRAHDIQIGGDTANDYINLEISETNNTYYALNTSGLNNSYTSLFEKQYMLYDPFGGGAHTYWDDSTYNLTVIKTNETNAVVDLRRPFSLSTGGTANFGMYWSDPSCDFAGCPLATPTGAITLQECYNTTMKASFKGPFVGDPDICGAHWGMAFQFYNGTWNYFASQDLRYNMSCSGGCYGNSFDNPPDPSQYLMDFPYGTDYKTSLYAIRAECYSLDVTKYSVNRTVNITRSYTKPNVTITLPVNNTNVTGGLMQINASTTHCKMLYGNFSFMIGNATGNKTHWIEMSYYNTTSNWWIPLEFNYSYFNTTAWGLVENITYNITMNATTYGNVTNTNSTVWNLFMIHWAPPSGAVVKQMIEDAIYKHPKTTLVYIGGILTIPIFLILYRKRKA